MGFFEPPPTPPERKPPPPAPPWTQPPEEELGVSVPIRFVLARTPTIALAITGVAAYSTGFELTMRVRSRTDQLPISSLMMRLERGAALPDDLLRFGVQYADGRKGTSIDLGRNLAAWKEAWLEGREPVRPAGPIVMQRGGSGGGGRSYDWRWWIWPLPPPGALTLACEWPSNGITLTTHDLDAQPLLDAASRVERFWPS